MSGQITEKGWHKPIQTHQTHSREVAAFRGRETAEAGVQVSRAVRQVALGGDNNFRGSLEGGSKPRVPHECDISLKFLRCQGIRLRWNLISGIKILESLQQLRLHQQKTFLRLMWGIRAQDSGW